jgi:hypothetical protein
MDKFGDPDERLEKAAEDFSLTPSPRVWENVELALNRRKRKKRFIILFFIAGGIITTVALFFSKANDSVSKSIVSITPSDNPAKENKTSQRENQFASGKPISGFSSNPHNAEFNPAASSDKVETTVSTQSFRLSKEKSPRSKNKVKPISIKSVKKSENKKSKTRKLSLSGKANPPSDSLSENEIKIAMNSAVVAQLTDSAKTKVNPLAGIKNDSVLTSAADSQATGKLMLKKDSAKTANPDTVKPTSNKSKWSIAFGAAPAKAFTQCEEIDEHRYVAQYRDSSDKNRVSCNFHLQAACKLLPVFQIHSGFALISSSQELLNKQAVYDSDTGMTSGPLPPVITTSQSYYHINGNSSGTVKNKFLYLQIPIGLRWDFLTAHKFRISLESDFCFNTLLSARGYAYDFQTRTYTPIDKKLMQPGIFSYGGGICFQYKLNNNLQLELMPALHNFQHSIYKASYPFSQTMQQVELNFSMRYFFN